MSAIRLYVFNNGLQLVGEEVEQDKASGKVIVKKPVQLVMLPPQKDKNPSEVGMAFAPFMQYADEWARGIPFSVIDLLTVVTPVRELVNNYSTTFGSGIILPQIGPTSLSS